jgi:glycerate kinase
VLASDVDNPLLGAQGAAAIFGPQKGATQQDVGARRRPGQVCRSPGQGNRARAIKAAEAPGAGAAGGVGYAAIAVLAATRRPGIDVVLEFTRLDQRLAGADLVITGEGSLDEQSLLGKTPMGVARAAAARRAGDRSLRPDHPSREPASAAGFEDVYALTELESNVNRCIAEAAQLLEQLGTQISGRLA